MTSGERSDYNYRQIQFHERHSKELEEMGMDTSSEIHYERAQAIRKEENKNTDSFFINLFEALFF
ncbi:MAG: hypothetical protein DIZ80_13690 [endosymbiont of Galathealinum brachiosum]|uniref:Uncharacterized protein n=1 Tax=endosymbiont of Galathealinum brachiosum TaxID=2200906 RepID=A0A370D9X5_9GAMM|nr:MAG: hypothetical protein DIZ80_13690 [endosymbiont of Galathealinum brachiosum]